MSSRNNNKLPSNLPQLQNLIKRDPPAYVEEVGVRRGAGPGRGKAWRGAGSWVAPGSSLRSGIPREETG